MSEQLTKMGYSENKTYSSHNGIKHFTANNDHQVVIDCHKDDVQTVINDVKRHVDGVDRVFHMDNSDKAYTASNTGDDYYVTYEEAFMAQVDPDGELLHLIQPMFIITLSSRPDDINNGSNTDRTYYEKSSIKDVVKEMFRQPYIAAFREGFTAEQKEELYDLSLRIQKFRGLEPETREITFFR